MKQVVVLLILIHTFAVNSQNLYSHSSATYRNQTWMSLLDDGIPLRKMSIIGTHSSLSTGTWGDAFQTQASSLSIQMQAGYRALDIRCRHKNDQFIIHQRMVNLGVDLQDVLNVVKNFLTNYPGQTILMHIVEEYDATGNSRSFEDTFIMYRDMFSDLIWNPTTQNPTLGMTRGKVIIIQNFDGNNIHGLLYDSFTTIQHKKYSTNWDQHDRWLDIKNFMSNTNTATSSRISFWTGSVGSFPYFVASGKSSPNGNRLATGLTTPGFSNRYTDFPRVACFIGICTIAFQGINILGYNYYTSNSFTYLGIVFTDFAGNDLIESTITINSNLFGVCTSIQKDQGCTICSTTGQCLACNEQLFYLFDSSNNECIAAPGYYLNSSSMPEPCADAITGCIQCSSQTVCILCDTYVNYELINDTCEAADGYYLDANSIPTACSIQGCYTCSSATLCTGCSSANNFIMDSNGDCICDSNQNFVLSGNVCVCISGYYLSSNGTCASIPLCPDINSGCSTCSGSSCAVCDANNYFISDSPYCICDTGTYYDGSTCQLCNATQPACQQCISDNLCLQCVDNFTLIEGQCQCSVQYYQFDSDTCLSCPIGCLDCSSSSSCITCDQSSYFKLVGGICECQVGMFVQNTSTQLCVPCGDIQGCLDCDMNGCIECDTIFGFYLNGTQCHCNYGQYISSMGICAQCRIDGCLDCDSKQNCVQCDENIYYLKNGQCLQICGDGVLYNLQCDDGNLQDGDGCSSECKVEQDYTCSGGSSLNPSACSFSGKISLQIKKYVKDPYKNKVTVKLLIQPGIKSLNDINYEQCLTPNFPIKTRNTKYNPDTNEIQFIFEYDQSLNNQQDMDLTFNPPNSLEFYHTNSTKVGFPPKTDNNLALKVYPDVVYEQVINLQIVAQILLYFSIAVFLFAIIFSSKLMGIQMIQIIQFGYIGLVIIDKMQALLYPFTRLWPVNGYNLIIEDSINTSIPSRVWQIGYKSEFLSNFSLSLIIVVLPLIIGIILYVIYKICLNRYSDNKQGDTKQMKYLKLKRLSYKFMKQWLLTGLLVMQFHFTASFVFAIMYGIQIIGIVGGAFLLVGLAVMSILFLKRPLHFGEYKQFFQKYNRIYINYYIFIILWRIAFISGIAALNQQQGCGYYAIALSTIQLISIIAIRPYKYNCRPIVNSIIMLVISIIYTIYRVNITDEAEWITTYLPIILLSTLLFTVFFNLVFILLYLVKSCKQKNINSNKQIEAIQLEMISLSKRNNKDNNLTFLNSNIRQSLRITTPHGAQNFDSPDTNLLKNLRLLHIQPLKTTTKNKDSMKEYEAI